MRVGESYHEWSENCYKKISLVEIRVAVLVGSDRDRVTQDLPSKSVYGEGVGNKISLIAVERSLRRKSYDR
ncbi:MAG: hypothetical protein F6J93_21510 [Oscillatoria sp. SIO1A7]|nr:hypothetical protein [Oscillatoria sp. SIO1A7]